MNAQPSGRAAVLGSPISHSLSPVLHGAAYTALGLDWTYEAIEVTTGQLAGFLDGLDTSWRGVSLTMPLKTAAVGLCTTLTPTAEATGAVNTLLLRADAAGGRRSIHGDNTDVSGMVAALRAGGLDSQPSVASILGGGATARSALAALAEVGVGQVTAYVRRPDAAAELRTLATSLGVPFSVETFQRAGEGLLADVVISTVPAGVADGLAIAVPWSPGICFDVVYDPWPTPLARAWQERLGIVVSGLDLLVHQAARQVELMTGHEPAPVAVMMAAGVAALADRSST